MLVRKCIAVVVAYLRQCPTIFLEETAGTSKQAVFRVFFEPVTIYLHSPPSSVEVMYE
jgi:hypothetical protein